MKKPISADCPLLVSGQLPVVQALERGEPIESFTYKQKRCDLDLLADWVDELEISLRGLRKDIYALSRVTNKRVVEERRYAIEHTVMPIARFLAEGEGAVYMADERRQDLADYDACLAGLRERLRCLERNERQIVKMRAWSREVDERISVTITPLADLMERGV